MRRTDSHLATRKRPGEDGLPGWDVPLGVSLQGGADDVDDDDFVLGLDEFNTLQTQWKIYDDSRAWAQLRLTDAEVQMIAIMDQLTDKSNWEEKIQDDEIWSRWTAEARNLVDSTSDDVTDSMMNFCRKELHRRAQQARADGYIPILGLGAADIVKSDSAVPEEFRLKLVTLLDVLENDPRRQIDWHPGQENVVRNLVHPSLYPLRYGHTTILPDGTVPLENALTYTGQGKVIPAPKDDAEVPASYSREFQWLPAEVRFQGQSVEEGVRFTSYINNLEWPRYEGLYHALEELLQHAIPLWNKCIATSMANVPRRVDVRNEDDLWEPPAEAGKPPDIFEDDDGEEYNLPDELESCKGGPNEERDIKWAVEWHQEIWDKMQRVQVHPEPQDFDSFWKEANQEPAMDLFELFRREGLQVIVKIAQIHLTPEHPKYMGGSWHVEGLANEHICATAIYYYDSANIKESSLQFRGGAMLPYGAIDYPQNEFRGLEQVYGVDLRDDRQIQDLATVSTPMRRLLAFPNVFQHCVPPFELDNASKPGHRKMVVLWLVNPDKRVISTERVPPQQRERFETYLREIASAKRMPAELAEMIATANTAALPSEKQAKEQRLRLMEERNVPGSAYTEITRTYNFCEH